MKYDSDGYEKDYFERKAKTLYKNLRIKENSKNIYIISSVRNASDNTKKKLEAYVKQLEENGHTVHLPHRDTNQKAKGIDICKQNLQAIIDADVIQIFYDKSSTGSHFDLGMAFALNKKLVIVENEIFDEGKSFARMIWEWENYIKYLDKHVKLKEDKI